MQKADDAAKNVAVKKEAGVPTQFNLEELAGQGQEFELQGILNSLS